MENPDEKKPHWEVPIGCAVNKVSFQWEGVIVNDVCMEFYLFHGLHGCLFIGEKKPRRRPRTKQEAWRQSTTQQFSWSSYGEPE